MKIQPAHPSPGSSCRQPLLPHACVCLQKGRFSALPAAAWHRFRARRESEQWSRFWKSPVPLNRIKLTVLEEPQRNDCYPMGCSHWQHWVVVPLLEDSPGGWQSSSRP